MGQRYIGAGLSGREIRIHGTPGNALGAYLDGCDVYVDGNAQDAIGDTMNAGRIIVNGNAGDAVGYAMRGGKIFIRGDAGYRVGIHMKAYRERKPAIVVGGVVGSFLGEYQAGGVIVVLDLNRDPLGIVGNFCGTGMHGGEMYLRCSEIPAALPAQVRAPRRSGRSRSGCCKRARSPTFCASTAPRSGWIPRRCSQSRSCASRPIPAIRTGSCIRITRFTLFSAN